MAAVSTDVVVALTNKPDLAEATEQDIANYAAQLGCFAPEHPECEHGCKGRDRQFLLQCNFLERPTDPNAQSDRFTATLVYALAHLHVKGYKLSWGRIKEVFGDLCDPRLPDNTMDNLSATVRQVSLQLRQTAPASEASDDGDTSDEDPDHIDNNGINNNFAEGAHNDGGADDPFHDGGGGNDDNNNGGDNNNGNGGNGGGDGLIPNGNAGQNPFFQGFERLLHTFNVGQQQLIETMQRNEAQTLDLAVRRTNQITVEAQFAMSNTYSGKTMGRREDYGQWAVDFDVRAGTGNWDPATKVSMLMRSMRGEARQWLYQLQRATEGRPEHSMFVDDYPALRRLVDEMWCHAGATYFVDFRKSMVQYPQETFRQYYVRADVDFDKFFTIHRAYITRQLRGEKRYLLPNYVISRPTDVEFSDTDRATIQRRVDTMSRVVTDPLLQAQLRNSKQFFDYVAARYVEDKQAGYNSNCESTFTTVKGLWRWIYLNYHYIDGAHREDFKREAYKIRDKKFDTTDIADGDFTRHCTDMVFQLMLLEEKLAKRGSIYQQTYKANTSAVETSHPHSPLDEAATDAFEISAEPNPATGAVYQISFADGSPPSFVNAAAMAKLKPKKKGRNQGRKGRQHVVNSANTRTTRDDVPPPRPDHVPRVPGGTVDEVRTPGRGRGRRVTFGRPGDRPYDDVYRRTPGATCTFCQKPNHVEADCRQKLLRTNMSGVQANYDSYATSARISGLLGNDPQ